MPRAASPSRAAASSELEGFVLGLVHQFGPASPYDIRRHMRASPSTQWSASAGAIYPLVARLERRGMVTGRARRAGKRARREYTITAKGLAALRRWVGPPLPEFAVTVAHDPLRSRARFLAALSPDARLAWIASARAALDEVEARVRQWAASEGSKAEATESIVTRSGELDVSSRRQWLDEVGRWVAK